MGNRRRPPPKRGPSLLPDSLIARASFTHGFPHYPNPNLPMALRPVVNRCANSIHRIDRLFPLDKGFGGLDSFTSQSVIGPGSMSVGHGGGVNQPHESARLSYSAEPEMTIESTVTGSSGRPMRGSFTGTAAMASMTSVPEVTWPKIV